MDYCREITARAEQFWCPIKHARRTLDAHQRSSRFLDYGDAEAWLALGTRPYKGRSRTGTAQEQGLAAHLEQLTGIAVGIAAEQRAPSAFAHGVGNPPFIQPRDVGIQLRDLEGRVTIAPTVCRAT